jgi:hypothetical protein
VNLERYHASRLFVRLSPIWQIVQERVWRGTDAPQFVAHKAAEARDDNAWAFWLEVERAVKELLTEAAPPGTTQQ